ncbi:MAG TPA: histidinol dehydrogenase [Candidatus Caldiarchaeum subterraneum]|uniref:Histidinol dehydrogenase n=1 Tax=Caldiarchaeum subterraneum TaxID=311458 RepID=A0A833EA59_CALS0|nr:histidinol dehydrogenase [Candidatus Caldarchaeum subterraneum]
MTPKVFNLKETKYDIDDLVDKVTSARPDYSGVISQVKEIVEDVRRRGDAAVLEYVSKLDNVELSIDDIRVSREELREAYLKLDRRVRKSLENLAENIRIHSRKLLRRLKLSYSYKGVQVNLSPVAIESVGCYIPGGAAAYPTTALMTVIPAKTAGVERIVAASPLYEKTKSTPVLAALHIAGVHEVYRIGGPHAVAALAYGTGLIKPVKKIIGPGGAYVTAAKLLVSNQVAVDMPAGPTELVVMCDETADARDVVLELCAQAEHSRDTMVGVVTTSPELAESILEGMKVEAVKKQRSDMIRYSWEMNGFVIVCSNMNDAAEIVNKIAPEHVAVFTKRPNKVASLVKNAGLISVGYYSSPVLCDYIVGVNHVLPTGGAAKIRGGLSILDYVHLKQEVKISKGASKALSKKAYPLALAEELTAHAEALERLR